MSDGSNGHKDDVKVIRIGSRDSTLALKQTYMVRDLLTKQNPELRYEINCTKDGEWENLGKQTNRQTTREAQLIVFTVKEIDLRMSDGSNGHKDDVKVIRIGSRDSTLALKQTYMVRDLLTKQNPELRYEITTMKTKGDKILDTALSKIGSKSLFTKELEMALEDGSVDIVVHSLKDLPTTLPEGMVIGAVCEREDPRDVAIMHPTYKNETLASLPSGSVIGTSSLRREAQLKRKFPHLEFESVRGNLNTRLGKLDKGDKYSALILAAAGVVRMGWEERITQALEKENCMYAVGQGALAVECRENDQDILDLLSHIVHKPTAMATVAERAFMFTLEGGCSAPVGVHTKVENGIVTIEGGVWSLDGSKEIKGTLSTKDVENGVESDSSGEGTPAKQSKVHTAFCGIVPAPYELSNIKCCYELGVTLAKNLLEKGAKKILDEAKAANAIKPPIAPQASASVKAS